MFKSTAPLLGLTLFSLTAAPPEVVEIRPALTAGVEIRPAALPQGARPLGLKERDIVKNLPTMSVEQLRELAEVYSRVGNQRMGGMLIAELTRRNPQDAGLATLHPDLLPEEAEDDPQALHAQELYNAGKLREAAAALQQLKAQKYAGKWFRYQQDLAYTLLESGQTVAAEAAFQELLHSKKSTAEEKAEAHQSLASMALEALEARGQAALTARDARRALEVADQLLAMNPQDPDGMALKVGAMVLTGHGQAAIQMLEALKAQSRGAFIHQKTLADAHYEMHALDAAAAAYQVLLKQPGYSVEDRTEARLRLVDIQRERLLQQGERLLSAGKISRAQVIAAQLELERPVHPDTQAFRAAILNKQHRYAEARTVLEHLQHDAAHPFTANSELGETYANTGAWAAAAQQYGLAENDARNEPTDRSEAARMRREMLARYRPTVTSTLEVEAGGEGKVWRLAQEASTGDVGGGNIFLVRANWDQVHLKGLRSVARQDADRFQAEVAYRRLISHGFFGEASIGGSDNDVVYGAKMGRYEGPGYAWEIGYRGNDRATDSLALEALNGRQNVLSAYFGTHFSKRFYLDSHAYFRQVTVGGTTLGQGWGFDMNIGYSFLEETRNRPEFAISYFNEISGFSRRSWPGNFPSRDGRPGADGSLSEALIDRRINRHGLILTISKQITPRISGYVYGGVSYEFANQELEGRAGAGIEAYLAPDMTLNVGLDYTTSGNAGNRGNDVLTGSVSVKMSF